MLAILILFNQAALIDEAALEVTWGDKHQLRSKIISICITLIIGLFGYLVSDFKGNQLTINLIYGILNIILYLGQRTLTFDYIFPAIKYKDLNSMWYLGTTDKWDIFLSQFNKYYILVVRVLVLIISILTFLLAKQLLDI